MRGGVVKCGVFNGKGVLKREMGTSAIIVRILLKKGMRLPFSSEAESKKIVAIYGK